MILTEGDAVELQQLIGPTDSVILLSLQEPYFNEILSGAKHYEYRKRFKKHSTKALVYISKTQKQVVGMIQFGQPVINRVDKIAALAERDQPGHYDAIKSYLGEAKQGYAIPVEAIYLFEPVTLAELKRQDPSFSVPQSYRGIQPSEPIWELFQHLEVKQRVI